MKLRTIVALTLALPASLGGAASQAATRYDFSYTGLYFDSGWNDDLDGFFPNRNITGFFEAVDTDGDGSFQVTELTDFAYAIDYVSGDLMTHVIGPEVPSYCEGCWVDSFQYTPGGTLTFVAHVQGQRLDDTISNTGIYSVFYDTYWSLNVTPQTIISVSTVPEPGAGLMLTAGLAALAYLRKRKTGRA